MQREKPKAHEYYSNNHESVQKAFETNLTVGAGTASVTAITRNLRRAATAVSPELRKYTILVVGEPANSLANVAYEFVVLKTKSGKLLKVLQVLWNETLQLIAKHVELSEIV
mmetsp:Transcript_24665/g.53429  ORF Transcript_24665/g.53429 Transcript_24665/m.53429 type:complete len:112 (+) Transcript_24665:142-477(+)